MYFSIKIVHNNNVAKISMNNEINRQTASSGIETFGTMKVGCVVCELMHSSVFEVNIMQTSFSLVHYHCPLLLCSVQCFHKVV